MSDASEVKRWWIKNEDGLVDVFNVRKHVLDYKPEGFDEKTPLGPRYIEVMRAEDHERIVAELKAEIETLVKVYRSTCPECGYSGCVRGRKACDAEIDRQKETIATQKRVIEKLIEQRNVYHTIATEWGATETPFETLEAQIAAIEKGEA